LNEARWRLYAPLGVSYSPRFTYVAIAGALPGEPFGVEPQRTENGDYFIWVAPGFVNKLRALGGSGES
jgi:hypothetical protein